MILRRSGAALPLALAGSLLVLPVLSPLVVEGVEGLQGAQAILDLTGTWTMDPARSDPASAAAGRGGRGGSPNQLVITKTETQLTVSQGGTGNYIYNLDGTERTGPPGGETKSSISWQDGKLVVVWKREFYAGPDRGYVTSNGKDVYTVVGNVLTVERMSATPPQAPQTRKTTYNKTP
jgi:hypothetical protein